MKLPGYGTIYISHAMTYTARKIITDWNSTRWSRGHNTNKMLSAKAMLGGERECVPSPHFPASF